MAEVYPRKIAGPYPGKECHDKGCRNYATKTIRPFNSTEEPIALCGQHLNPYINGMFHESRKAIVVQEIPGHWARHKNYGSRDGTLHTFSDRPA